MQINAFSLLILLPMFSLAGCAPGASGIFDTLRSVTPVLSSGGQFSPLPGYDYLRVLVDGRTVYLAKGYVEPSVESNTDVWYSAEGEVLKLQNGRIVATAGLATDWRRVRYFDAPSWRELLVEKSAVKSHERERDVMPGYRFNLRDRLQIHHVAPPRSSGLMDVQADSLVWFVETGAISGGEELPPALFALSKGDIPEVIYSEQCLSRTLCFSWQRLDWPKAGK